MSSPTPAAPYTLVLLRHGESEWNALNLFTGWVDVALSAKGRDEAERGGRLLVEAGVLPGPRPHVFAAAGHHDGQPRARCGRAALDPGRAQLAAQRAALRRAAGQGQEGDPRGVRRGAVHALAPVVRRAAPAAGRRQRVLPGARRPVRRPDPRRAAEHRVPGRCRRPDAALLGVGDRPGPAGRQGRPGGRARQQPAGPGEAPRRHLRGGHRRPQHPDRDPPGLPARRGPAADGAGGASTSTPKRPRTRSRPSPTRAARS